MISHTMKNCPLEKWFSAGEGLNPQGRLQCLETVLVVISWRVLMHRTAPTTKGYLVLNDSSGKPCPGGTGSLEVKGTLDSALMLRAIAPVLESQGYLLDVEERVPRGLNPVHSLSSTSSK